MESFGLCKASTAILLVATAGVIYHLLAGSFYTVIWWLVVGGLGTGVFQALCYGGLEPVAWVLMLIPVLIVCFFLAVALFASRMRIENIMELPCDRCSHRHRGGECPGQKKPWCNKARVCGDEKPRCSRSSESHCLENDRDDE
jgi:hypothetical protein